MCKTDKKTRNYIVFFAMRQKPRKLNTVNFWLPRTKPNWIQQNFLYFTIEKIPEIRRKTQVKTNWKRRNQKISLPREEIVQRSERKMKVVHQKDDKNKPMEGFHAKRACIAYRADFYFCRIKLIFGRLTCVDMKSIIV